MELYLEAHVTISPVFDEERDRASNIAQAHGFKLAHLIMLKDKGPNVPSQRDTFMTGHGKHIDDLAERTQALVKHLTMQGFKVWRYKIESCVIDSRQQGDIWEALDKEAPVQPLIACDGCQRI
jgi:hypothetical protein